MGAKYLCCLPLRLGVLLISFFQFLGSASIAGVLAYVLILHAQGKDIDGVEIFMTSRNRIIAIVLAAVSGLAALVSLTGFIGAIRRKQSYVGIFSILLRFFLVLQIAVVVAYFVFYFVDKDKFKKLCLDALNGSTDQRAIDACNSQSKISLWALIVPAVVSVLSQAYGVYIVAAYARKLRYEEADSFAFRPGYVQVGGEESRPLTHKVAGPYVDNYRRQAI
ncbi:hypothetical protein DFH09DRAFT_1162841 [Mycena vulgaris]|nr:hypothetical protein DFH09DRAFT_1162841 [Mycena vulgaris]